MKLCLGLLLFFQVTQVYSAHEEAKTEVTMEKEQAKQAGKDVGLGEKRCIVVNETRERLCYGRAKVWCDEHKGAKECRRFLNTDVSK